MAASNVLKAVNAYVNGRGYAGELVDFSPPKLTLVTEDFRSGSMLGAVQIPQGIEVLTTSFTLVGYDPDVLALWGIAVGKEFPIEGRGYLESQDGTKTAVVHTMRGIITEEDPGTWQSGQGAPLKTTMNLTYYKLTHGDRVLQEIDLINSIHIVNGVDQMSERRAALAI